VGLTNSYVCWRIQRSFIGLSIPSGTPSRAWSRDSSMRWLGPTQRSPRDAPTTSCALRGARRLCLRSCPLPVRTEPARTIFSCRPMMTAYSLFQSRARTQSPICATVRRSTGSTSSR
jgi:hypothetical protein